MIRGEEKEFGVVRAFTSEERNLMYLHNSGIHLKLIDNLADMRSYLQADETKLLTLTDCVLGRLRQMDDREFSAPDLYPDFMDRQEVRYCRGGNHYPGSSLL